MEEKGAGAVTPELRAEERDMQKQPLVEVDNFNAGYIV